MKKLFLVTSGDGEDGSEWDLHAIFSTRDKAQFYVDTNDRKRRYDGSTYSIGLRVEEWDVDAEVPK